MADARPQELAVETTPIPGLLVVRMPVHGDARGWFKENWQREKMVALGLPDFGPVQNNISFNASRGATRGIHTEPWDKFVSLATGRIFGAWVDMREGESFGTTFHLEVDPSVAVFVPRGVGNSYQALEDGTAYTYLVNAHWRPGVAYPALHLGDEAAAIPWPIPLDEAEISEKDHHNPRLGDVVPMQPKRTLVLGAGGQLGRARLDRLEAMAVGEFDRLTLGVHVHADAAGHERDPHAPFRRGGEGRGGEGGGGRGEQEVAALHGKRGAVDGARWQAARFGE